MPFAIVWNEMPEQKQVELVAWHVGENPPPSITLYPENNRRTGGQIAMVPERRWKGASEEFLRHEQHECCRFRYLFVG